LICGSKVLQVLSHYPDLARSLLGSSVVIAARMQSLYNDMCVYVCGVYVCGVHVYCNVRIITFLIFYEDVCIIFKPTRDL